MNFTFDPTNVADEYANCQAEVVQSIYPIKLGLVSYEEGYEDALSRSTSILDCLLAPAGIAPA